MADFFGCNDAGTTCLEDGSRSAFSTVVAEDRRGRWKLSKDSGVPLVRGREQWEVESDFVHAEDVGLTVADKIDYLTRLGSSSACWKVADILETDAEGSGRAWGDEFVAKDFLVFSIEVAFVKVVLL